LCYEFKIQNENKGLYFQLQRASGIFINGIAQFDDRPFIFPEIFIRDNKQYIFKAVTCHRGNSFKNGHYIAYCKRNNNQWYEFNDEIVTHIPGGFNEVLTKSKKICSQLFYERDLNYTPLPVSAEEIVASEAPFVASEAPIVAAPAPFVAAPVVAASFVAVPEQHLTGIFKNNLLEKLTLEYINQELTKLNIPPLLFYEEQQNSECGAHSMNNLLQNAMPYFQLYFDYDNKAPLIQNSNHTYILGMKEYCKKVYNALLSTKESCDNGGNYSDDMIKQLLTASGFEISGLVSLVSLFTDRNNRQIVIDYLILYQMAIINIPGHWITVFFKDGIWFCVDSKSYIGVVFTSSIDEISTHLFTLNCREIFFVNKNSYNQVTMSIFIQLLFKSPLNIDEIRKLVNII
jgi:hypothetical protein